MKNPKIIAIANQKGGQGRTTTTITLGHGLAMRGKQVLLVDTDPQGQVATFLGLRQESGLFDLLVGGRPFADVVRSATIEFTPRPNLQVIPGDRRTATAQVVMAAEGFDLNCLLNRLSQVVKGRVAGVEADYVIVDTSPSVGLLQEAALFAADWLIAPCAVDYASTEGLAGIMATLSAVRDRGGRCRLLGVLPTFYDEVTVESAAILAQLQEHFGEAAWPPIHRATVLRECTAEGLTIFEKAPSSRAAMEYEELTKRVLCYG